MDWSVPPILLWLMDGLLQTEFGIEYRSDHRNVESQMPAECIKKFRRIHDEFPIGVKNVAQTGRDVEDVLAKMKEDFNPVYFLIREACRRNDISFDDLMKNSRVCTKGDYSNCLPVFQEGKEPPGDEYIDSFIMLTTCGSERVSRTPRYNHEQWYDEIGKQTASVVKEKRLDDVLYAYSIGTDSLVNVYYLLKGFVTNGNILKEIDQKFADAMIYSDKQYSFKELYDGIDRVVDETANTTGAHDGFTMYRSAGYFLIDDYDSFITLEPPYVITNPTVCSCSMSMGVALNFMSGNPCCLFKIKVPPQYTRMVFMHKVTRFEKEYEVLLPRGAQFKVKKTYFERIKKPGGHVTTVMVFDCTIQEPEGAVVGGDGTPVPDVSTVAFDSEHGIERAAAVLAIRKQYGTQDETEAEIVNHILGKVDSVLGEHAKKLRASVDLETGEEPGEKIFQVLRERVVEPKGNLPDKEPAVPEPHASLALGSRPREALVGVAGGGARRGEWAAIAFLCVVTGVASFLHRA